MLATRLPTEVRSLLGAIGGIAFVLEMRGDDGIGVPAVNEPAARALGLPAAAEVEPWLERRLAEGLLAQVRHCLEQQAPVAFATRIWLPDGGRHWHVTLTPFRPRKTRTALVLATVIEQPADGTGTSQDARLAGQLPWGAALLAAVSATSSGIAVVDGAGAGHPIVHVNAAFCALTGYPAEALLGRPLACLHGPETDRAAAELIDAAIVRGLYVALEVRHRRADGTSFWNEVTIGVPPDEGGTSGALPGRDVPGRDGAQDGLPAPARRRATDRGGVREDQPWPVPVR